MNNFEIKKIFIHRNQTSSGIINETIHKNMKENDENNSSNNEEIDVVDKSH